MIKGWSEVFENGKGRALINMGGKSTKDKSDLVQMGNGLQRKLRRIIICMLIFKGQEMILFEE